MRKESADNEVIDGARVSGTNVGGEVVEIVGIGLDGMGRRVALAQGAEEVGDSFFGRCLHLSFCDGVTAKIKLLFCISPCLFSSGVRNLETYLAFARG